MPYVIEITNKPSSKLKEQEINNSLLRFHLGYTLLPLKA